MKMSQNDVLVRKQLYRLCIVVFAVLYSLYCFVISPLYVDSISNIVYSDTVIPDLLMYLGSVVELLALAAFYAIVIFGTFRFSPSCFKCGTVIFAVATLCKYSANTFVDWYKNGSVPVEWLWDVINILFYLALELLQLIIILVIINGLYKRHKEKEKFLKKVGKSLEIYPFRKLCDKQNPLVKSAISCSLVVFASKTLGQLINDVYTIIIFGLPSQGRTVWFMVIAYLSNLIFGVLCYVIIVFVIMKLMERYAKQDA